MVTCWTPWKSFPVPSYDGRITVPYGPGVYEVQHAASGKPVAFGETGDVAQSLAALLPQPTSALRAALFGRKGTSYRPDELEYRVWAAGTLREAKAVAERLRGRRKTYWLRRTAAVNWA